jgi:hypothetical protein
MGGTGRTDVSEGLLGVASKRSRETAYGDLVAGLLDVRVDPATERFDAELAAAEADGRIDASTAKVLRWWQRESLRTLVEHARTVVPPTLMALESSAEEAGEEVDQAAQSWARAVGDETAPEPQPSLTPPADLTARRRRMLEAGLTRKPREQ